jgi:anti-sigma regulatory factor (Ser/Thr protein kinase)
METSAWEATALRKALPANENAPKAARDALSFVGAEIPEEPLQTALLLASELVTNSVVHGPAGPNNVGLLISVERNVLRIEVSDGSPHAATPKAPSEDGGLGLTLVAEMASRWGSERDEGLNVTWFELDLQLPGAPPLRASASAVLLRRAARTEHSRSNAGDRGNGARINRAQQPLGQDESFAVYRQ